jgi:hypothetical protein
LLLASRPRAVKEPLPDVPASAGAFVHAFRKQAMEIIPFQGVREDLLEREGKPSGVGCGQRSGGSPADLVLSKTAGARGEFRFLNGLIAWPA